MKKLLLLCITLLPAIGFAQSYSISSFTIDGGGGTSTSAVYSVSGTIGQHDAGPTMTNGQFSIAGGFWVLPQVVFIAGAPTLKVTPAAPGFATISWTPATPGFVLQEASSLSAGLWTNSPSGSTNPVTVPASGAKFFRLHN
jgi:hypothetical protein